MAVTWVREFWEGRSGSVDEFFARTQTRIFRVLTDDDDDGPETVRAGLASAGIYPGATYVGANGEVDVGSYIKSINLDNDSELPNLWLARCEYGTVSIEGTSDSQRVRPDQRNANPTQRGPEIEWGVVKFRKPAERNVDGIAILNSAKDKFDPPGEIDDTRLTLTISKNLSTYDEDKYSDYFDSVNDATWWGKAAGLWKCDNITGKLGFENGTLFWRVTFVFHHRRDGWVLRPLDQGYQTRSVAAGVVTKQKIEDKDGQPVSSPQMLDSEGGKLDDCISTLLADITAGAAQLSVAAGHGTRFPTPGFTGFDVKIGDEIINVLGKIGDTFTLLQRGMNGTTAAAHSAGDSVEMQPFFQQVTVYKSKDFSQLNLP